VVGRRQLFYAALAAGGIQLIGFVSNYLVTISTGEKGSPTLLIVAGVVSVIGGTVTLVLQNSMAAKPAAAGHPPASPVQHPGELYHQPAGPGHYGPYGQPVTPQKRNGGKGRLSLIVALILMIVLCGVGGTAVTSFATAVIDKLNAFPGDPFATKSPDKNDPVRKVLAHEASAKSGSLTVKVTQVEANSNEARFLVTAINDDNSSVSLPLYKNCQLGVGGGSTLEADPNQSQWAITVPAHGQITGVIIFHGRVLGATSATLSFANVFRLGGGSIAVEIALTTGS
jgi:hypothetical protein